MRPASVILFMLISSLLLAQAPDTIKIHRPLLFGIHYYKCQKIWFGGSYSCTIVTKQDGLLMNDSDYYFKIYGYTNKLILEGNKGKYGELYGEVKFYYKNGRVKKIEFYRTYNDCVKDTNAIICDGTSPWGTWKYYDKKGRLRKTVIYSSDTVPGNEYLAYKTITRIGKRGEILYVKKTTHHPCEP